MSFQPVIPFGGMAGWAFLERTRESQQKAFAAAPELKRDTEYFRERIGSVKTADDLVGDYRLLKVALGAFGLDEDINNKFFIRKILEDGTIDPKSLSNKLSDKRYRAFSKAFGFGDLGIPNTSMSDFADRIVSQYETRQFEATVGEQQPDLRLSLGLERELGAIVEKKTTPDGMWFSVMGNPPLRKVFETALGLPQSVGTLDIDRQLSIFRDKAAAAFGDGEVAQFSDPEKLKELNRLFLVRSQIGAITPAASSMETALALLQ